jgi:hypothetical protein
LTIAQIAPKNVRFETGSVLAIYRGREFLMRSSLASRRPTTLTAAAALVGIASVLTTGVVAGFDESTDNFIQRVIAETTRSGVAVRATRHLEAGTVSGKHRGWMDVETAVAPNGSFTWNVIGEGGSERTREKVFRAVLEAESIAWRAGARDAAAISPANYQFVPISQTKLQLKPKRQDSKLVDGVLTVNAEGHPVMLEGRLAKSPSFWVRSVTIMKRYTRVGDVSLPVVIESLADVKMFGKSSFSMRYHYTAVNGRSVGHTASSAPAFGPSPQLLALHAQLTEGQ